MNDQKKRVFICAERKFPRGDAGANRVLYIAQALIHKGHEVIVISIGENRPQDYCQKSQQYFYKGVQYKNVSVREGLFDRWDSNIVSGYNTVKILKDFSLNSDDFVWIYTTNPIYGYVVNGYCTNVIGAGSSMDVVEKFQFFQYRLGYFDPMFWKFVCCFKLIYKKSDKIVAISKHLEKNFKDQEFSVLRLPALIDCTEYTTFDKVNDGVIRLIYAGQIGRKEALDVMLSGLLLLSDSERARIEFHFTRTTKNDLVKILGSQSYLIDRLDGILYFHNWLSYESLVCLYDRMDFLMFARQRNEATISNFPSKVPELLACGIPTIANKVGDFADYLEDNVNSILFEKCTVDECCNAIRRVLDLNQSQLQKMSKKARMCAENQFDYRVWSNKIHEFVQG